jgi:hypothetical protein
MCAGIGEHVGYGPPNTATTTGHDSRAVLQPKTLQIDHHYFPLLMVRV